MYSSVLNFPVDLIANGPINQDVSGHSQIYFRVSFAAEKKIQIEQKSQWSAAQWLV